MFSCREQYLQTGNAELIDLIFNITMNKCSMPYLCKGTQQDFRRWFSCKGCLLAQTPAWWTHIVSSSNTCLSCQARATHFPSCEGGTVTQDQLSLVKVVNCTRLAYFWPASYDYTRAVQLQEPEVYPPLLPLLSTYTHLQMCSQVYLQTPCIDRTIGMQQVRIPLASIFPPKEVIVTPAPQFISMEQRRSHSPVTQASPQ